eukprot:CAMPEP_0202727342 /NCGR_PEP_ID=MMETSP1385-20130828/185072_1 /ASSEMBLY_ACC=CAM_ASM_000861 /TAXON_ID=933848 /ORGANISM="Elphidium margaritaceum" /LENGTH=334 /DNA_ID=CAMNT_0049393581 /DNA_START=810 /DNA_END=1814 /DNA_ORIENTATION=+
MPQQYDALLIRKEMNRLIILYAFSTVWFTVSAHLWETLPWLLWFDAFFQYLFNMLVVAMVSLWPHFQRSQPHVHGSISVIQPKNEQQGSNNNNNKKNKAFWDWQSYVNASEDDRNWNRFMRHLQAEMAVENLCFILEVNQFKMQFAQDPELLAVFATTDKVMVHDEEIGWLMKLPPGLPTSSIIASDLNHDKQISKIYEKYISADALLAINIGFDARSEFMYAMHAINGYVSRSHAQSVHNGRVTPSTADDLNMMVAVTALDGAVESERNSSMNTMASQERAMQRQIAKVFDACLSNVCDNLADSFTRFKDKVVDDESDVILEMMTNHNNKSKP